MGLLMLRTLRCDARCCGGGGVNRKEVLIKGLTLFFLCSLTLQYVMNTLLATKTPIQRVPLKSTSDAFLLRMPNSTIIKAPPASAFRTNHVLAKTPTPQTLAVPFTYNQSSHDVINAFPNRKYYNQNNTNRNHTNRIHTDRNHTDRKSVLVHRFHVALMKSATETPPATAKVDNIDQVVSENIPLPIPVINHALLQKALDEAKPLPEEVEIPPSLLNETNNDLQDAGYCPKKPPKLVGEIPVTFDMPTLYELAEELPELLNGGRWRPKNCLPRHRVAIIIPYRDREEHLRIFLAHIHPFLQKQLIEYGIYLVEQNPRGRFNRAMLMNIGFQEAMRLHDYDCCIFHDVDLLPEDDRNLYTCPSQPRHMSAAVDTFGYRLPYPDIFGGVVAIAASQFRRINGFSNMFFGWGGEDDDMYNRIKYYKLKIRRYPMHVARYRMIRHLKDSPSPERMDYLKTGRSRFRSDGLNGLKYKVRWVQEKKLFTWLMVDLEEKDVLSMYPQPEVQTVLPLDQAEGDGNEARRRMKEREEQELWSKMRNASSLVKKDFSRFDADTYSDEGENIKGGLTILSPEDVRNAKAKFKAQIKRKMDQMKLGKLKTADIKEPDQDLHAR